MISRALSDNQRLFTQPVTNLWTPGGQAALHVEFWVVFVLKKIHDSESFWKLSRKRRSHVILWKTGFVLILADNDRVEVGPFVISKDKQTCILNVRSNLKNPFSAMCLW
ncbi:hypothetical protein ILYODFUR_020595 [Ilyodon furcidens]|uniref:Uncharacterized protein n=1 Tax=Ilyodon furcidens TaxID=33524 RepID=A0ABV0TD70_9TELE